jgi:hypothetical protein
LILSDFIAVIAIIVPDFIVTDNIISPAGVVFATAATFTVVVDFVVVVRTETVGKPSLTLNFIHLFVMLMPMSQSIYRRGK